MATEEEDDFYIFLDLHNVGDFRQPKVGDLITLQDLSGKPKVQLPCGSLVNAGYEQSIGSMMYFTYQGEEPAPGKSAGAAQGFGTHPSPLSNPRHRKPSGTQGSPPSGVQGLPLTPQGPKPSGILGLSPISEGPSPSASTRSGAPGDLPRDPGFAVEIQTEPYWEVNAGGPSSQGDPLGDQPLGNGALDDQTLGNGALGGYPVPVQVEGLATGPRGTGGTGLGCPQVFVGPSGSGGEGGFAGTQGPGAGANPKRKGGARAKDAAGFRSPAIRNAGGAGGKGKDARKVHVSNVEYIGMSEQRLVVEKLGKGPGNGA